MGSTITWVEDTYSDYMLMCKIVKENEIPIRDSGWLDHMEKIIENNECKSVREFFIKML